MGFGAARRSNDAGIRHKGSDYASYAPELFETDIPRVHINHGFEWYEEWAFPDKVDEKAENKYFDKLGTHKYDRITREWLDSVKDLGQYVVHGKNKLVYRKPVWRMHAGAMAILGGQQTDSGGIRYQS